MGGEGRMVGVESGENGGGRERGEWWERCGGGEVVGGVRERERENGGYGPTRIPPTQWCDLNIICE